MKNLFFVILLTIAAQSVNAKNTNPLLIERNDGSYELRLSLPSTSQDILFTNGKVYRLGEMGSFALIRSTKNSKETRVFFQENGTDQWLAVGTICASFEEVHIDFPKDSKLNFGWLVSFVSKDCSHTYERTPVSERRSVEYREK